jgi:hypothetical protein
MRPRVIYQSMSDPGGVGRTWTLKARPVSGRELFHHAGKPLAAARTLMGQTRSDDPPGLPG